MKHLQTGRFLFMRLSKAYKHWNKETERFWLELSSKVIGWLFERKKSPAVSGQGPIHSGPSLNTATYIEVLC